LAWDGRLDNRDNLIACLSEGLNKNTSDVSIVLAAYLKWGNDFLNRIVGDFVLSLWDPLSQRLLLARDPFGTRTLYYFNNSVRFIWSSTLEALFRASAIDPEVDDEYVAGFLALHPETWRSPYKNILAVEPGHLVTVGTSTAIRTERFWNPNRNSEIRYQSDAEYEEHFRQLFRDAVRCRLRATGPVWLELSGGLDSSSIACIADDIIEKGEAAGARLDTISYLEDEAATSYDRKFLSVLAASRGKSGHLFRGQGHWVRFVSPEASFISKPSTSLCVAGSHERLCQLMANDGARVLLNGLGGDQVLWSIPTASPELADLVFQRSPLLLHKQLQIWSHLLKRPYWQLLWREAAGPLLPESLVGGWQSDIKPAPWLERDFVNKTGLRQRLLPPKDPLGYRLPSSRMQARNIFFIISSIATGNYWEDAAYERSYPFLHRPLVEFLMAIPFEQKLRPGETRSLMRRALKDLVPEKILQRRSKGVVGEAFCRGLDKEWHVLRPMLMSSRACSRGYVNQDALITAVNLARHGKTYDICTLLQTIALEIWLRSLEYHFPISLSRAREMLLHTGRVDRYASV
jgi:asparagine synthase (glutamine-hydrolysing)